MNRKIPVGANSASAVAVTVYRLTQHDRCDACGAQAFVSVRVHGVDLLFCAHHYAQHADRLEQIAEAICDERDRLNSCP